VLLKASAWRDLEPLRAADPAVRAAGVGVSRGTLESQRLLIPQTIDVSSRQIALLEHVQPLLARLGIEVLQFGPSTVAVQSFPSFLEKLEPGAFVRELLERGEQELLDLHEEELLHEVLDMMACKAAVKAGDPLSAAEIETLLRVVRDVFPDRERRRCCRRRRIAHVHDSVCAFEDEVVDECAVGAEGLGADTAWAWQQVGEGQLGDIDLERLEKRFFGEVAHHLLHARLPEFHRQFLKAPVRHGLGQVTRDCRHRPELAG